jgi:hypothetical protein
MPVTAKHALATLDGTAEIGSFLFVLRHPRWPRQVQWLVMTCNCRWRCPLKNFANGNLALNFVSFNKPLGKKIYN